MNQQIVIDLLSSSGRTIVSKLLCLQDCECQCSVVETQALALAILMRERYHLRMRRLTIPVVRILYDPGSKELIES